MKVTHSPPIKREELRFIGLVETIGAEIETTNVMSEL